MNLPTQQRYIVRQHQPSNEPKPKITLIRQFHEHSQDVRLRIALFSQQELDDIIVMNILKLL